MKDVLLIILGWLLGLLSPLFTSLISRRNRKRETQKIIIEELKDIKIRLTLMAYQIRCRLGSVDKDLLIWVRDQASGYDGYEELSEMKADFIKQDFDDPAKLRPLLSKLNESDGVSSSFSEITADIIDSNYVNLAILPRGFYVKLLEIKFQLGVLNYEGRSSNEYLRMTFDSSLSATNRSIVEQELINKATRISRKSILIVKKINLVV